MLAVVKMTSQNAEDLFHKMGIEGGADAVTHAAASFISQHPLYSIAPSSQDLTEHELKLLRDGGFPKVTKTVSLSNNLTIVAGEIGVMIASALSQKDAAHLMGVDESRIRQRISQGTLYAISGDYNKKVLPRFQFTDTGTLPGLEKVLPVINKDAHPMAVQRFFLTVSEDLYSKEMKAPLSPRDWLITRHPPEPVTLMVTDF